MKRRNFLKIAGSSAVILAAGAGGWVGTRTPTAALAPWGLAGGADYTDPRVRALSYAILAPNPHNRQPWIVDLATPGEATLLCDLDRLLPATDPFSRQIVIGLGCFLEILRIAAAEEGFTAEITPFPEGQGSDALDGRPIAHIRFSENAPARDPLFAQVLRRRSNKEPYDISREVVREDLSEMAATTDESVRVGWVSDPQTRDAFRDLTWRAHLVEVTTPYTMQESIDLMRIGKAEINANPDGIELPGPMFEALNMVGIITRETLGDPSSSAFQQGLDIYEALYFSAMAHFLVVTEGNARMDQLNAGRAWVRVNLKATELGLGIHPLSQALQEYPEMAALYTEVHQLAGVGEGETIQMLGRVGYGPRISQTPRWRVETRLRGI